MHTATLVFIRGRKEPLIEAGFPSFMGIKCIVRIAVRASDFESRAFHRLVGDLYEGFQVMGSLELPGIQPVAAIMKPRQSAIVMGLVVLTLLQAGRP